MIVKNIENNPNQTQTSYIRRVRNEKTYFRHFDSKTLWSYSHFIPVGNLYHLITIWAAWQAINMRVFIELQWVSVIIDTICLLQG